METKILSIVVPTRNRQETAKFCIESILAIPNDNFELIIHDNSDTNKLEKYVEDNIEDERLLYVYDDTPMSTVHNFNKAMKYVNAEYVCYIGDDDGVNAEIIEATTWAKNNDIDALVGKIRVGYNWPYNGKKNGSQVIYPFTGKMIDVNIDKELDKFLLEGGVYYLNYTLPKVYHGIVKKKCFDKVNTAINCYFGGLSPDIFSSVSLSLVAKKVAFIDYPLTISGSSVSSNQTHRTEKAKKTKLKDAPHLRARGKYIWSEKIPNIYSRSTIWAESGLQALEQFERYDLIEKIDKYKLAVNINLDAPQYAQEVLSYMCKKNNFSIFKYKFTKIKILLYIYFKKAKNRIAKIFYKIHKKQYYNVENIVEASNNFFYFIKKYNISLNYFIKKNNR